MSRHSDGKKYIEQLLEKNGGTLLKDFWDNINEWLDLDELVTTLENIDKKNAGK